MIKIGTRNSPLALLQVEQVLSKIKTVVPNFESKIIEITSSGDKNHNLINDKGGIKGMFTKELDLMLLSGDIDIAIHSLKDVASVLPKGLELFAVLEREDPRDALVSLKYNSLSEIPAGGTIGTSSIRRKLMLKIARPDLNVVYFRGNIATRIQKLQNKEVDAIILAVSGLKRLSLQHYIKEIISSKIMLPAISQGTIGIFGLSSRQDLKDLFIKVNHPETMMIVNFERDFASEINADCGTPIGILTAIENNAINTEIYYINPSTNLPCRAEDNCKIEEQEMMIKNLSKIVKPLMY